MIDEAVNISSTGWAGKAHPVTVDASVNILSVDVECWDWIICRKLTGQMIRHSNEAPAAVDRLLERFAANGTRGTFFVVGSFAEAFPDVVRRIDEQGHEVAAHGHTHTPITRLTRDEFRDEVQRSIDAVAEITGKPVLGFRAPEFSIVEQTMWALEVLVECGIAYDSSIFPFAGPRYGVPEFPRGPVRVDLVNGSIVEVPPSVVRFFGRNLPVGGGGYFRFLPYGVTRRAVAQVQDEGRPFVLYLHSYEFCPDRLTSEGFPRPINRWAAWKVEFMSNLRKPSVMHKLESLLTSYRFTTMREALRDALPA